MADVSLLHLNGRDVTLRVTRTARARRVTLRVVGDEVRMTLPTRAVRRDATLMLARHATWVAERLAEHDRRLALRARELGLSRDTVLLRGVPVPARSVTQASMRHFARGDLLAAVARHRHLARKRPLRVVVRDQRSRWGSCSTSGTLSFNWRLVMAPPDVLDYLAVHEIVHLDVPNHSAHYWKRVLAACPDARGHDAWLNRYVDVLMRHAPLLRRTPQPPTPRHVSAA